MSDTTLQYKCPSCGGALVYGTIGKFVCDNCGNEYELDAINELYKSDIETGEFNWGDYKKKYSENKEFLDGTVTYICKSCGAVIETTETTAATHCPYCDNEVVIGERLSGGIKPNAVIPFKIDKKGLKDAVFATFKGKKLLPKDFISEQKMSKIQGVYVPFWLFDAGVDGRMNFDATIVRHHSDSRYDYTETSHYLATVDGNMAFADVPVDASRKMDNDLMDSLEPFDFSELTDFDSAYLAGFLADRFDDDPDVSIPRASERMKNSAAQELSGTFNGQFTTITKRSSRLNLTNPSVKYVLLPVYLLNFEYKGKKYRYAVNGQTGKVVGELPIDKVKKRLYFWLTTLGVAVAFTILSFLFLK